MSILLPHFLNEGRGKLDTYFSRVYNPIWTNPDGFTWLEALKDPEKVNCHVALTPTWSETSWFADYVLPMGVGEERHDVASYETHAGKWIGFRQSVFRRYAEIKDGKPVSPDARSHEYNPREVWEENEFWIDLSWKIDPDGSMGIRKWFESDERPGNPISIDEYYGHIFAEEVPGLAEAAAEAGQVPLEYMRDRGAFAVLTDPYTPYEKIVSAQDVAGCTKDASGVFRKPGTIGTFDGSEESFANTELAKLGDGSPAVEIDGEIKEGFPTPSKKLELFSTTLEESGLVRISTRIGHFVIQAWRTEGIRPGVVAASHHMGRWRLDKKEGRNWAAGKATIDQQGTTWTLKREGADKKNMTAYESADPDTGRIWWHDSGVHQNATFCVQPDPISGMQCWHQRVRVTPAAAGDEYGDVVVDTAKSREAYLEWMEKTRPAGTTNDSGLRRPLWYARPLKPTISAYRLRGPRKKD